jgi:signal transduction histidine kinase
VGQVLNNLLSNAIKFSHAGTHIKVRVNQRGDWAMISVQDEGQGIPVGELKKLFDWFGKTSIRGTDGEKSSGLGLAIARKIVEGHGGEIWLESQLGVGTTAYVKLPIRGNRAQVVETEIEEHG